MSDKQQSAVDWLFEKLFDSFEKFNNGEITFSEYLRINLELRNQAKELFKQQIIDAYKEGDNNGADMVYYNADQYFNETFKTESNGIQN